MSIHVNTETYKIVNNEKSVMLYEKMDLNYYKIYKKGTFMTEFAYCIVEIRYRSLLLNNIKER